MTDPKPKVYPCNVCGEDAIACLRPDMDVRGLCFCESHRLEVGAAYTLIMQGFDDMVEEVVKDWKFK